MTEPRYMFFLAHTGRDTERAKELRNLLHPGVPIFLDTYDLVPGDEWDVELPPPPAAGARDGSPVVSVDGGGLLSAGGDRLRHRLSTPRTGHTSADSSVPGRRAEEPRTDSVWHAGPACPGRSAAGHGRRCGRAEESGDGARHRAFSLAAARHARARGPDRDLRRPVHLPTAPVR